MLHFTHMNTVLGISGTHHLSLAETADSDGLGENEECQSLFTICPNFNKSTYRVIFFFNMVFTFYVYAYFACMYIHHVCMGTCRDPFFFLREVFSFVLPLRKC